MALLGKAVVAIWNDITDEGRSNFVEWHNRQHVSERVAIPGFHRGRRYIAERGSPEYFTLYEAADESVLTGSEYLARLNNPTDWTREATSAFRNTERGVCRIVHSTGTGDGGYGLTVRFDADPGVRERLQGWTIERLTAIERMPWISGAHLCIADATASGIETAEKKGRQVAVPNWIVMIEGSSAATVDAAGRELADADLLAAGMKEESQRGLYRLEFSLVDFPAATLV
ncbi:MAG: hypothetical protein BGN87_11900 [Rhizobiales bacterium 65-79]|jgi:hypothetical protein|nr:hypothetical protein [Hyphomicrobiales bacterium]OJU05984.1 MAG: hypothetical protein BGN87_11900 [Rhizobiales bacterium 65-79]